MKKGRIGCGNCGGGLVWAEGEILVCPKCEVRIAGPFKHADDVPDYKPFQERKRKR